MSKSPSKTKKHLLKIRAGALYQEKHKGMADRLENIIFYAFLNLLFLDFKLLGKTLQFTS